MENRYKAIYDLKNRVIINAKYKQGDTNSAVLEISLVDGGLVKDITGQTIVFKFIKPDSTIVFQDMSVEGGVTVIDALKGSFQCKLKNNTLAVPGVVTCEIEFSNAGVILSTSRFNFTVESSIAGGSLSTNYISAIENKIIEMQNTFDENEAARQAAFNEAETARAAAEILRENTTAAIKLAYDNATKANLSVEVSDARLGEVNLKTKLQKVDSQLADMTKQKNYSYMVDINVDEAVCLNNPKKLTLPTYVEGADGEVVHPSVLFFPNKWNGYHYWMAMTPYKNADSAYENPSILASNDKTTWVEPIGIINPVVPRPATGFNADPCIFMDSKNEIMYMVYKYSEVLKHINICQSTDGVNWSTPISIITTATEYVSPTVTWDGDFYTMWFVDVANTALCYMTSVDPSGTWENKTNCNINMPVGKVLWHLEIIKFQNQYHMIALVSNSMGASGLLYFAKSDDKLNWKMTKKPILQNIFSSSVWDTTALYKSSMIPIISSDVGIKYGLFYASATKFYVGYTEIFFNKTSKLLNHCSEVVSALNSIYPWFLCDTFNRADSATSLGNADTGQTWVTVNGTLGISNKQVYAVTAGSCTRTIDIGKSDYYLSFQIPVFTVSSDCFIHFRRSGTDYWRFGLQGNVYVLLKYFGGVSTTPIKAMKNPAIGDWLSLKCVGSTIECYINGILSCSVVDSDLSTATVIGIGMGSTDVRLDNLIVRDLI